jgi:acyl-CoA hydrolase
MQQKYCVDSLTVMTEIVMPNDTNYLHNLMGGQLLNWMDICAAVAAQRHCNNTVVTISVDNVTFQNPIPLGNVVTLRAFVTRAFSSSMEVYLEVTSEHIPNGYKQITNNAFFTFVAVDASLGKPVEVPQIVPQTEVEQELNEGALRRRQLRLLLAGRMKASDASELRELFM